MLFWIWTVALIAATLIYFQHTYSRFRKRGVKNKPALPLVGNSLGVILRKKHFIEHLVENYIDFPKERFVGRFEFVKPVIIIRDLELIKRITVKDFDHFVDHRTLVDKESDPLFGRNIFSMKGDEWKDMRGTLSPAFTSSKIRVMVPFMVEVGDQMIKTLRKKIKESDSGYLDCDVKDLMARYANDVIASCAFGLKVDSHTEENNEFYVKGRDATNFGFKQFLVFFGYMTFPELMKHLNFTFFSDSSKTFFKNLVQSTMRDRELHHIVRPDMIHLLMQAKKGQLTHDDKATKDADAGFATVEESSLGKKTINRVWTEDDLIAQAVLFFIAGFETVSSAMSFLIHELAVNPDVQEKLLQEIRENEEKNDGKFDYNSIQNMTYMDMVVSEVLRLWPPAAILDRQCTRDYNLGKPNEDSTEDYIVREGEGITIPMWAIHRDPDCFPDPLKFDPERFSAENVHKIKPYTYMPFGLGPRNCIGSRFALCEVKVMAYQLLRSLELSPAAKTQIPAKLSKKDLNMRIEGGHWVRFKIRD